MKCGRVLGSEGSVKALKVGHACVSWGVDVEVVRSIECRRLPRFGSRTKSRRVPGRYLDESVSWTSARVEWDGFLFPNSHGSTADGPSGTKAPCQKSI